MLPMRITRWRFLFFVAIGISTTSVDAFTVGRGSNTHHRTVTSLDPASLHSFPRTTTTTTRFMCICIDCKRVTNCAAYHFVETKHAQPHMTDDPTFEPREGSPTIHVNVRTIRNSEDRQREIERMWREHESETERAQQEQEQSEGPLIGKTKYDLSPVTTYEYDVVECADFVQDKGAWVRNMPQEIRDANPDFVPT